MGKVSSIVQSVKTKLSIQFAIMTKYIVWCESCGDLEETVLKEFAQEYSADHQIGNDHEVHIDEHD